MPTSRSNYDVATLMLATDHNLLNNYKRIRQMIKNSLVSEIEASLEWLLTCLAHDNCLLRDATVRALRIHLTHKPQKIPLLVAPLLVSENAQTRAEGYHLIGYLGAESTEKLHGAVFLGLLESELEVRERAVQALKRLSLPDAVWNATCNQAITTLVLVLLHEKLGDGETPLDYLELMEVFRLSFQGRSGESPIAATAVRRAIRRILEV